MKHRILIVDDEPQVCTLLTRWLPPERYDVVSVQSGLEAKRKLSQEGFDLVVSDIRMPDLDGIELLRTVRECSLDLPVVLMTGAPDLRSAIQAIELGAVRYLEKPVESAEFRSLVDRTVTLHELARLKRRSLALLGLHSKAASDLAGRDAQFQRALGSLYMVFQPIISLRTDSTFAHEALVRAHDDALPHPGALLEAAERLDKVWLLSRSIRQLVADALSTFQEHELLFVNLHPKDLDDPELYSPRDPLAAAAQRVVLEITERSSLDRIENLEERIHQLCSMGYRIALDDLGAGYAGLSSLMQLNPHFVKFDMSLVRDIHMNASKQKLVGSMTRVCEELGIRVVSEGVETTEERDMLASLGADLLQGYLFGKPSPRAIPAKPRTAADARCPT
jgi:EAL domain-containing protein (putative c-di-GMP-specific phosphodiesterase class I)